VCAALVVRPAEFQAASAAISKNYAGFYPLRNLATPKNQLAQIRTVRAKGGRKSGKPSI
jgi:hypothetical protein